MLNFNDELVKALVRTGVEYLSVSYLPLYWIHCFIEIKEKKCQKGLHTTLTF